MLLNIEHLIDNAKCYGVVRDMRWPEGAKCAQCGSGEINNRSFHNEPTHGQRYEGQKCA